jgi:hypothetical protein
MKHLAIATCLLLAAGCGDKQGGGSSDKGPCAKGTKVETVALPAWFEIEDVGYLTFEPDEKPVFTPKVGAADADKFQKLWDAEMKPSGEIALGFEAMEGSTRHFCSALFRPGDPEYPMAVVYFFALERGDYKYEMLGQAPAPEPPAEKPATAATASADSIGSAKMKEDGTIVLQLRAEGPGGIVGDALVMYRPDDPKYKETLDHLGGLKPGEEKPVPPWPEK